MTKKELIGILKMVYDHIPECKCEGPAFCSRHDVFTEAKINYIRIAVNNLAITDPLPPDPLLTEFITASQKLFTWYDGKRSIITEKGYTCPTPTGAHGMTMLRTVMHKAEDQKLD